jgi:hypothetical protein
MKKSMYLRTEKEEHKIIDLGYFGKGHKPRKDIKLSDIPKFKVNDISENNLVKEKIHFEYIKETLEEVEKSQKNTIKNLEERVIDGEFDCIALYLEKPVKKDDLFYTLFDAEMYKFKKRN